jgi:hypothetical protein
MRTLYNARNDFARRLNPNGTPESICLHCFTTVRPIANGSDVRLSEIAHYCWQREDAGPFVHLTVN